MTEQTAPPILSTPESNIFEDPTAHITPNRVTKLSSQEIRDVYEIERTAREVLDGGWRSVALQFPDGMLGDAPGVYGELERELEGLKKRNGMNGNGLSKDDGKEKLEKEVSARVKEERIRLAILADTSYGSCCVDEIAAEHVAADVVIHYGRACLSPTARLHVIYVYTSHPLDIAAAIEAFGSNFEKEEEVVVMADLTYNSHVSLLVKELENRGWQGIRGTEVIHNPTASIPNRRVLWHDEDHVNDPEEEETKLKDWKIFHISDPPPALLLTLSSRIKDLLIYPTTPASTSAPTPATSVLKSNTSRSLSRRYALLTHLSSTPIIGILINTLSVSNYLSSISTLRSLIHSAGKKSYTFVVGKVNAAKMANFSEVGGWVVVGCWESSLIESRDFFAPVVTPFELGVALIGDEERVWSGRWRGDFDVLQETLKQESEQAGLQRSDEEIVYDDVEQTTLNEKITDEDANSDSEEESTPPEFDLRTGRYISNSRPMKTRPSNSHKANHHTNTSTNPTTQTTLARRAKLDIASVNGTASPGAEYLRNQRTWMGLGSDFDREGEEGDVDVDGPGRIEEGRRGVARGYVVGGEAEERT
jgi:diphthamide biosynthesis protein 2